MKICVIISSEQWRATAGVRIRYNRLQPALEKNGHTLELKPIGEFTSVNSCNADVYIFSKTHDVRAVILARLLRASGKRVGIDIFDDYYSQIQDSRFVHLRRWFREMLRIIDFAMCSTTKMAQRMSRLAPNLPCQILNDPFGQFDPGNVVRGIAKNISIARNTKRLKIGWFGIGDNPHFSVGLEDLFNFSGQLQDARRFGYDVELEILTNPRALTAQRMKMLARLPVPFTLTHWTEEAEAELIARSVACFLPVNGQGFSVVKSLNRGISTLTGGSQILSSGFPLYDLLDKFVYRNIGSLIVDIEAETPRLRGDTISTLVDLMEKYGTASREADALIASLGRLPFKEPVTPLRKSQTSIVLHGTIPSGSVHKSIRRLGALSVAAPQTQRTLNFDVALSPGDGSQGQEVLLSEAAHKALRSTWRHRTSVAGLLNGKLPIHSLILSNKEFPQGMIINPITPPMRPLSEMARYISNMKIMHNLLNILFDDPVINLSETTSPYWTYGDTNNAGHELGADFRFIDISPAGAV